MNPISLAKKISFLAPNLKVAAIIGDDVFDQIENLKFPDENSSANKNLRFISANAYLGAGPILQALQNEAQVIITGRCVDSALVLAPLMHEYNINFNQLDQLSTFSLAGHIIECGAQSTGGIFTDWDQHPEIYENYSKIGFPIVEFDSDKNPNLDQFAVTKPEKTGGLVSFGTVAEQLVYEIGDPENYKLPDVICDWSDVEISGQNSNKFTKNHIIVSKAKGKPKPENFKVSATHDQGYKLYSTCLIFGGDAVKKAKIAGEAIIERAEKMLNTTFKNKMIYPIGSNFCATGNFDSKIEKLQECCLWISAEHDDPKALNFLATEIAATGTGGPPGFTALVNGRPKPTPVFRLVPKVEINRDLVNDQVEIFYSDDKFENEQKYRIEDFEFEHDNFPKNLNDSKKVFNIPNSNQTKKLNKRIKIQDLAFLRSGDKGNHCNIGVVAKNPEHYQILDKILTEEFVRDKFAHFFETSDQNQMKVEKFYLPGISGFNFMLYDSLGGGGVASIRPDPQGKAYGQILGSVEVDV